MSVLSVPAAEREGRVGRLRAAMAREGLEGLLAYAPAWRRENVRYLTAAPLRSSMAFAYLPAVGRPTAFVMSEADGDAVRAAGLIDDVRPLTAPGLEELTARVRDDVRGGRLGIGHAELVPYGLWDALARGLPGTRLTSATALLDAVRLVKSDWEIERLRACAVLCDDGWAAFLAALRPGLAEYELVAEVESALKAAGAQDNFMLIASGGDEVRGMTPPSRRRMQAGDMVRTELTPQLDGYWAQICRTAVVGAPRAAQRDSFELFEESVAAGLDALRPGVSAHDVAKAENDVFRRRGYGEYCTSEHTRVRGHGHGLHLDEVPLVEGQETILETNSVVIIHPNTFTPLAGYHVLGDPVVVRPEGPEPLLRTPRELSEVPA
jgi:Xaa-Pro dipeptidase